MLGCCEDTSMTCITTDDITDLARAGSGQIRETALMLWFSIWNRTCNCLLIDQAKEHTPDRVVHRYGELVGTRRAGNDAPAGNNADTRRIGLRLQCPAGIIRWPQELQHVA